MTAHQMIVLPMNELFTVGMRKHFQADLMLRVQLVSSSSVGPPI